MKQKQLLLVSGLTLLVLLILCSHYAVLQWHARVRPTVHFVPNTASGDKLPHSVLRGWYRGRIVAESDRKSVLALAAANNGFGLELFSAMIGNMGEGENVLLSPTQIATLLQLLANGATGNSYDELVTLLKLRTTVDGSNGDTRAQKYSYRILDAVNPLSEDLHLAVIPQSKEFIQSSSSSTVQLCDDSVLSPDFVEINDHFYQIPIDIHIGTAEEISFCNSWETQSEISITLRSDSFFEHQRTYEDDFHLDSGKKIQVPYVVWDGEMHFEESDYHKAVHLPARFGNLSLSLYLPSEGVPVSSLVPYILSASFVFPASDRFFDPSNPLDLELFDEMVLPELYGDSTQTIVISQLSKRERFARFLKAREHAAVRGFKSVLKKLTGRLHYSRNRTPGAGIHGNYEAVDDDELDANADGFELKRWFRRTGTVRLPGIELSFATSLADTLRSLGLRDTFSALDADFDRFLSNDLNTYVQDMHIKANMKIEAMSDPSNIGELERLSTRKTVHRALVEPFEMRLNQPFLIALRDTYTQSILFLGRVSSPV